MAPPPLIFFFHGRFLKKKRVNPYTIVLRQVPLLEMGIAVKCFKVNLPYLKNIESNMDLILILGNDTCIILYVVDTEVF